MSFHLEPYLKRARKRIDAELDARIPAKDTRPGRLHEAMRYSVFAGGKRLRPILSMAAAEAVNGSDEPGRVPGVAVEILHTYTLIHDDLPAMDDDDLRRGRPTLHRAFDEGLAILAGDALLTLAFEWLAACPASSMFGPADLVLELARASGSAGIVAGQVEDLEAEGREPDAGQVEFIHLHKTARLLTASVRLGAMAAGMNPSDLEIVSDFGREIGLAFQIRDDILDETETSEALGKDAGSDVARGKLTWVRVHGMDASERAVREHTDNALSLLQHLPGHTTPLHAVAEWMAGRRN